MAIVTIKTDILRDGIEIFKNVRNVIEEKYANIKNLNINVSSFNSFKNILESKFVEYKEHSSSLTDQIDDCITKAENLDVYIDENVITPLSNSYISSLNEYKIKTYAESEEFSKQLHKYLKLMTYDDSNPYNLKGIGNTSLYDVADITPEEMKESLEEIKANPGRDAVAKAALLMIGTAADAGYKLNYRHAGTGPDPHVPTDEITNGGVDCNAFASWLIDKGTSNPTGFYWRAVETFGGLGEEITDYTQAQCGDIFATSGHVGVIMENHPDEEYFITAEAKGSKDGILFAIKTYSELKNTWGAHVRDLTDIYNGTVDPNVDRYSYWPHPEDFEDSW